MFTGLGKIISDHEAAANAVAAHGSPTEPSQSRYDAWYENYLKSIEQYKGTSFYNELLNNPYASRQEAPLNFFQQLWKGFTGVSAAETNFYNQREQSAAEYMSQILDAHRQQEYNDPAAQMARQKAAGLNPELNGGQNISSGETGDVAPDDTPPVVEAVDDTQAISQVASIGFSLFQNFMSIASGMQQLQAQSLANDQAEFNLTDTGWNQLIKLAVENVSPEFSSAGANWGSMSEEQQNGMIDAELSRLMNSLQKGTFRNMYDRRTTRRLVGRLESLLSESGTDNLAYRKYKNELIAKTFKSGEEAAESAGKYGFSENILEYGNILASTFSKIEKEARIASSRIAKAQASRQETAAEYEDAAYTAELGSAENAAGIASADAAVAATHLDSYIDKELDSLMKELEGRNDIGALLLRFLIPTARAAIKTAAGSMLGNAGQLLKKPGAGITINTH